MRTGAGAALLAPPLVGMAVGWALDNGPLLIVAFFGCLVWLWGCEVGTSNENAGRAAVNSRPARPKER